MQARRGRVPGRECGAGRVGRRGLEAQLFIPPFASLEAVRLQPDWPQGHAELHGLG
jgi:hypothetical protein